MGLKSWPPAPLCLTQIFSGLGFLLTSFSFPPPLPWFVVEIRPPISRSHQFTRCIHPPLSKTPPPAPCFPPFLSAHIAFLSPFFPWPAEIVLLSPPKQLPPPPNSICFFSIRGLFFCDSHLRAVSFLVNLAVFFAFRLNFPVLSFQGLSIVSFVSHRFPPDAL